MQYWYRTFFFLGSSIWRTCSSEESASSQDPSDSSPAAGQLLLPPPSGPFRLRPEQPGSGLSGFIVPDHRERSQQHDTITLVSF